MSSFRLHCLVLTLALASCGGGSSSDPDAGDVVDAESPVDAQTEGSVTVRVLLGDDAVPGVVVVFHDPDGNEIADALTDANGEASYATMPVGGAVTIVRTNEASSVVMQSVTDIPVDGTIIFRNLLGSLAVPTPPHGSIDVTLPSTTADSYLVDSPCRKDGPPTGAPGATVALSIDVRCEDATEFPIVVYGINGGIRTTESTVTLTAPGVAPNLGAVTAPDPTTAVAQAAMPIPSLAAEMPILGVVRAQHPLGNMATEPTAILATGSTALFPYSVGLTDSIAGVLRLRESSQPINLFTQQGIAFHLPATAEAGQTLDLVTGLMPAGSALTVLTDSPLGVSFSLDGDASCGDIGAADFVEVTLSGEDGSGKRFSWNFVRPYANEARVPRLLGANAGLFWPETTFVTVEGSVNVVALAQTDYAGFVTGPSVTRSGFDASLLPLGETSCARTLRPVTP